MASLARTGLSTRERALPHRARHALRPAPPPARRHPRPQAAYQVNIQGKVIQITQGPHDELVALTEDGRVFTWDLSSASKTQTSIDGRLVKGSDRDDTRRAANGELAAARQAVSTPAPSATSPTRRPPSPTRQLSSPSKSASATPAQPRKQSISALKKSVNVIRAT